MEIDGTREEENIVADYSLQDIWLLMVTIWYNLTKLNQLILYFYLTDN